MNTDLSTKAPACLGLSGTSRREILEAHQETLARIEAALTRLSDGSYGACTGCGNHIAIKRLDDDPAEAHCLACAD